MKRKLIARLFGMFLIGGFHTAHGVEPAVKYKSIRIKDETCLKIANSVKDVFKNSLNKTQIEAIENYIKQGCQVNMGDDGIKAHVHCNQQIAPLHVTLCNNKTPTCKKKDSYKGLTLQGKIGIYRDKFQNNHVLNRIMTVNIKDPNKELNGVDENFHIKLIQWIPEENFSRLKNKLRKKGAIDIHFQDKPDYEDNFHQPYQSKKRTASN